MLVIEAKNVNDAWHQAKVYMNKCGVLRHSRVGTVMEYPDPVTTKYHHPTERVLFDVRRDANPFFHFMEGLWMLAGRNDVKWISKYNQRMNTYSDNGETFHAAYGHRWRRHFGRNSYSIDQLKWIADILKSNHDDRRAVLQMWDPRADLGHQGKDLPCNTAVYFKVRNDHLFMTVTNRSNDIVWGCYGANCVHMSMLQEYMAAKIGVDIGPYFQISDSWHAYTERWEQHGGTDTTYSPRDLYRDCGFNPFPLVTVPEEFDNDLSRFMDDQCKALEFYANRIFSYVAVPMARAWRAYKERRYDDALNILTGVHADDWRVACQEWVARRLVASEAKKAA